MKCRGTPSYPRAGGHSSIRAWTSPLLVLTLGGVAWWAAGGVEARAEGDGRAVGICCAWGNRLSDNVLTYSVTGDDPTALSIIRSAVQEWDEAFPDLSLKEVPPGARRRSQKADISIVYGPGTAAGGESHSSGAQGITTTYLNNRRMVTRVEIGIDGGPPPVNAGAVEQIAKHEMGHALGLGHANWDGDLMSPLVQPTPAPIPLCDINAVREANSWKMVDNARRPKPATATEAPC
jgi:Matrixin